jgi:hypothetical protein
VKIARAFSVPIESERRLYFFILTRFLDANRYPLRSKTLWLPPPVKMAKSAFEYERERGPQR